MNLRSIRTIFQKELLDTVRERRTLIMMVAVPLLLYPVLLVVGLQAVLFHHSALERRISRIAFEGREDEPLRTWLSGIPKTTFVESRQPEQDLSGGGLDAVVVVEDNVQALLDADGTVPIRILYDATEPASRDAAGRVTKGLDKVFDALQAARLERHGIAKAYVEPLDVEWENVALPSKTTGTLLGLVLPVIMVVMIALGAFYPAVDLTAGEKERGTFETLLSTPTSKFEIVAGKFLAVFCLAMATGILNLASMAGTFTFMLAQIKPLLKGELPIELNLPFEAFFIILLVIIPLAFFISALMMSVAVFARTFKEAQNYVTPFFLLIMFPAMAGGFPGIKLSSGTQFIPIANVVLLFKGLMTGEAGVEAVFYVFLSTAVFALLALLLAAWLFQREEVVLSEQAGVPISLRRADFRPRSAPTSGMALTLFALVLLLMFYVGSLVQQRHLLGGLIATEWALILAPTVLFLWFVRVNLKKTLNLRSLSAAHLAGAVIAGVSGVILLIELSRWHNNVLPVPQELKEVFEQLFATAHNPLQLAVLLFAAALSPAICEEVLFRGAILSGLRQRLGIWPAMLVVGALFGIFHISIYRILPTALMGVLLTYLVIRTGSILAGIVVHGLLNALVIVLSTEYAPAFVQSVLHLDTVEEHGVPPWLLAFGVLGLAAGVAIIELTQRPRHT